MKLIDRKEYPELNLLLWDIRRELIEPEYAFQMYEQRWGYVSQKHLTEKEKLLIEELTQTCGKGYFLPHR